MKSSNFAFDSIHRFQYKCHRIFLNCDGLYINSPDQIKKKATINLKNNDDKCFQKTVRVALNHENMVKDP